MNLTARIAAGHVVLTAGCDRSVAVLVGGECYGIDADPVIRTAIERH